MSDPVTPARGTNTTLDLVEPRQLGTLHARMAYVMTLLLRDTGLAGSHHELWHAIWDLDTLVKNIPDLAFDRRTGTRVVAVGGGVRIARGAAKLGLPVGAPGPEAK